MFIVFWPLFKAKTRYNVRWVNTLLISSSFRSSTRWRHISVCEGLPQRHNVHSTARREWCCHQLAATGGSRQSEQPGGCRRVRRPFPGVPSWYIYRDLHIQWWPGKHRKLFLWCDHSKYVMCDSLSWRVMFYINLRWLMWLTGRWFFQAFKWL